MSTPARLVSDSATQQKDISTTVSGNKTYIDVSPFLNQTLDSNNSKTITAAIISASDPWVGDWTQTRSTGIVRQLVTVVATDATEDGLGGTFTFEYSENGSTATISEARTITDFQTIRDFDLLNAGEYFRVKFSPSRALSTDTVTITTQQRRQNDGSFVRIADQQIEKANAAMGQTFSYLKGFGLDDRSADFPFGGVDPNNSTSTLLTNSTVGNFTVDAGTDVCTINSHGLSNGDDLVLSTTDTLPAGLAVDTQYFVITATTNTFQLSATSGGSAIDITDTGTGTHTAKEPGTFTGTYRKTAGYAAALPFAFGDQKLSIARIRWSANGTDSKTGLLATSTLTASTTSGFEVYISLLTTMVDGFVRIELVNGSDDQTSFEGALWFYSSSFSGSFNGLDADLSAISTALLTRSVIAGSKPDSTFVNVSLTNTGALQTGSFLTEVAKGDISNHVQIRAFGVNSDVGASSEFISETGAASPYFPTSAVTVEAISGNAADNSTSGGGARTLYIEGLDGNFAEVNATVNMNGTSATTATTQAFIRVTRAYVVNTGTYRGANTGIITVRQSSAGTTFATIAAGVGESQLTHYCIPASKTFFITQFNFSIKAAKPADIIFWQAPGADDVAAPFVGSKRVIKNIIGAEGNATFPFSPPIRIEAKTDIWWTGTVSGGGGGVAIGYSGLLETET